MELTVAEHIVAALREEQPRKTSDIIDYVSIAANTTEGTAKVTLSNMLKDGRLEQPKRGYYQLPQAGDGAEMRFPETGDAELSGMIGSAVDALGDDQGPPHLLLLTQIERVWSASEPVSEEQKKALRELREGALRTIRLVERLGGALSEARRTR